MRNLSVEQMASAMNVSRSVLFARTKQLLGTSPGNLLLNIRIDHARELLHKEKATLTVSEVAYKCGFSDPKYFSRCFKKLVGQTPTEYQDTYSN